MSKKIIAKTNFNELLPNIFFLQFYTINSYVWILHSFQVNWGAWCDKKVQFHCSVYEYLPFPATFVEETILSSLGILVSLAKYSVQFSWLVVSNSLQPHGLQHARLPCPSPSPKSCSNSCPSSHLILCCPLLLLPSIFPSIRVFSNESVFPIRWPKYWSFSFSISPCSGYSGLIFL